MMQANTSSVLNGKQKLGSAEKLTNVAIMGNELFAEKLFHNSETSHNIIGFIKMGNNKKSDESRTLPSTLGDSEDLAKIAELHKIDRIWLAVNPHHAIEFSDAVQKCKRVNLAFDIPTTTGTITNGKHLDDAIYNDSSLYQRFMNDLIGEDVVEQPILYRIFDLILSLSMFLLFLPSWIFVAIAIKLESKGNVLYSQERMGKGGKIFRIYKFRSMYSDAEKRSGPQLASQNDPRITKVGLILRKTRIDELPQLFNVIKGDMSLIGPRPERPYFVEKYRQQIPRYVERLRIKPGLTGHAQVESGYDESLEDVKIKLQHDLYFIENYRSLKLFSQIIVKTVWVVLAARGQ